MNYCVPDFEMDDDYSIPTSSVMVEDDVMELLWQNGQVVFQSQNQRSFKKSPPSKVDDAVIPADQSAPREIPSSHHHRHQQEQLHQHQEHLFIQEDEMASWLHYPLNETNFDSDFCADLLYSAPCVTSATTTVTATAPVRATTQLAESRTPQNTSTSASASASASASRPPIPPSRRTENFVHFSRLSGPAYAKNVVFRESTMVDSSDTSAVGPESRVSEAMMRTEGASGVNNLRGNTSGAGAAGTSSAGGVGVGARDLATCEMTLSSSTGGSSASASASASAEPPSLKPPTEDRKRKGRENDDECHSEGVELESVHVKKQTLGSTSTKRSRAAEVHNLSERRRRDRINEKMRALQELIPRCNKSDKASMLDEAIQYLKSLQLQVQMMSMGCGMVPMMFPGVQQYGPNMGMGIGMGMGMEMGMSRPMMMFPNVLSGSALPTPATAAHLGPRFPMLAFPMPPVPDPSRVQVASQSDLRLNSYGMQNPNQPPLATNFADSYQQQYLALHQMQLPLQQSQTMVQLSASKPSTSKGAENPENHPSGT